MAVEKEMALKLFFFQYFQSFQFPHREYEKEPNLGLVYVVLLGCDRGLPKEKSAKWWGMQQFTARDDQSPTQNTIEAAKKFQNLSEVHDFRMILLL